MDQQKIGKFIQERRKEKELTQVELAEKLGVSNRTISKWENGNSLPDYSMFNDLCKELDITINELLSGEKLEKENYQKKLEENFVDAIEYNNKIRNKKFKRLIIMIIVIAVLYFLYKLFMIFYFDTRFVGEESNREFPINEEIYTIDIKNNSLANKKFDEYDQINVYVPDEFELVTDKVKSGLVMDDCDLYMKNQKEKEVFDAAILICHEYKDNIYNLDYYGIESTLFPFLDVYKTLEKYDIYSTLDLIKYYEKNYDKRSNNVFTSSSKIKMDYIADRYVRTVIPTYDKFYYFDNDLRGYMTETGNNSNRVHYQARFYIGDNSYGISFFNNEESYFEYDNVTEIMSSIFSG